MVVIIGLKGATVKKYWDDFARTEMVIVLSGCTSRNASDSESVGIMVVSAVGAAQSLEQVHRFTVNVPVLESGKTRRPRI
jgi:hypothetical protein